MKAITLSIAAMLAVGMIASPVKAQEDNEQPDVDDIVQRTNYVSYYQGDGGRSDVNMSIVSEDGGERNRRFTILRWDAPAPEDYDEAEDNTLEEEDAYLGAQRFYVYFRRPSDWANTVFMVHKYVDKTDNRWLYQPALDLVNRISAADKRNSFVGSHFFYEDVSGRHPHLDEHELVDTTDMYYILKNTPKDPDNVEFDYYKMWIHKDSYVVVQSEFYDDQGQAYRRYNALDVEHIQGFPTVTKSRMTDLTDGSYTEMSYTDVEYNVELTKDIFTKRYLRNPPQEYLE